MNETLRGSIDRILAIGHAEFERRRNPCAKQDALVETTVAVSDLFLGLTGSEAFNVSDVSLLASDPSRVIDSSFACFDQDIRDYLATKTVSFDLPGEFSVVFPELAKEATPALELLWRSAWSSPGFTPSISERPAPLAEIAGQIQDDFYQSLRHAFDTIVEMEGSPVANQPRRILQTLRVERFSRDSFAVTEGCPVPYSLGYWLPTSTLYQLAMKATTSHTTVNLRRLEEPFKPVAGGRIRTSSHTFVHQRKAGMVHYFRKRPATFSCVAGYEDIEALEDLVWDKRHTAHVFMMPMASYGDETCRNPTTLAHAFLALAAPAGDELPRTIEQLLLLRHRARVLFHASLYQGYCNAVARFIADRLLAWEDLPLVNAGLQQIAAAYAFPSRLEVIEYNVRDLSLKAQLERILKLGIGVARGARPDQWSSVYGRALEDRALVIHAFSQPTEQTDILVRLVREVESELGRQTIDVRLTAQLGRFTETIRALESIKRGINDLTGGYDGNWDRLSAMRPLFAAEPTHPCKVDPTRPEQVIRLDDVDFTVGHDAHQTPAECAPSNACSAELEKRLGYLFDKKTCTSFKTWASSTGIGCWNWLKHACEEEVSRTTPSVATIVAILWMEGATVGSLSGDLQESRWKPERAPIDWPQALHGLAKLTRDGQDRPVSVVQISYDATAKTILFQLDGDYTFVNSALQEARKSTTRTTVNQAHSAVMNVAHLFMTKKLPIAESAYSETVDVTADSTHLNYTWKI